MEKTDLVPGGSRPLRCWIVSVMAACTIGMMSVHAQDLEYSVTVQEVLGEIQKGIHQARQKLADNPSLPKLSHVELNLNTVLKTSRSGGIRILIFSFGKKWEKEDVQKLSLRLEPIDTSGFAGKPKPPLSEQLANAIVGAAVGVGKASLDADVPLHLQKLSVELGFIVRTEGGGSVGLKFGIEPITVDLQGKGNVKKEAIQKLTVVFEERQQPK